MLHGAFPSMISLRVGKFPYVCLKDRKFSLKGLTQKVVEAVRHVRPCVYIPRRPGWLCPWGDVLAPDSFLDDIFVCLTHTRIYLRRRSILILCPHSLMQSNHQDWFRMSGNLPKASSRIRVWFARSNPRYLGRDTLHLRLLHVPLERATSVPISPWWKSLGIPHQHRVH